MKIWILRPADNLDDSDNPWAPWYDKAFGFVVTAETEEDARALAHEDAGDENRGEFMQKKTAKTTTPWKDPAYSTCDELGTDGCAEVVMMDFAGA